ncbi:hypothetical protein GCK72_022681 [Caenorhabditis remanei]|uniref:Uncharacterized protein n=1 Tax=Caenorhabditis remanei TaxID=31234 RepID=A0A6A5FUC9_CAERE|nr:hypothetical protein GCK72_022681 [Caenorhabditis remanei]KAF1746228.1 hypothetical protein GCK72_022681 [Caenorhabditis remanei]
MLSHILSEFMNSIIYQDTGRLERNLEEGATSQTGMQQLYELFNGNRVEVWSNRIISLGEVTSTIVFTD